jgi:hypothetical protein
LQNLTASENICAGAGKTNTGGGGFLKTVYVRCKVLPGLFDTELYVLINGSSSAYVTPGRVKVTGTPRHGNELDGQVLVYVVSREKDRSLVEVSGEPVVGGLRTWVPNEMIATA